VATDKPVNVQDVFLNHVRKNKTPLTVFLINGVKLQGVVTWFDSFSMLLRRDGHSQLVYKHAISTVMPQGPIQLFDSVPHGGSSSSESNDEDHEGEDEDEDEDFDDEDEDFDDEDDDIDDEDHDNDEKEDKSSK
jgi:host factor-I protein